jgi:hypothetical protein
MRLIDRRNLRTNRRKPIFHRMFLLLSDQQRYDGRARIGPLARAYGLSIHARRRTIWPTNADHLGGGGAAASPSLDSTMRL